MNQRTILVVLFLVAALGNRAAGAFTLAGGVQGNSAAAASGGGYLLLGTSGQPCVGKSVGPDHRVYSGYWGSGSMTITAITDPALDALPGRMYFSGGFPNPAGAGVSFSLALPVTARIDVFVFDVGGRRIRTWTQRDLEPGHHRIHWDGRDAHGRPVAHGAYFVRLFVNGDVASTRKVVIIS